MKEYFISLILISFACGIVDMLSPKEDIGKYIRFAFGICIFCILISPVRNFFHSLSDVTEFLDNSLDDITSTEEYYENIFKHSLKSSTAEEVSELVKNKISSDMKINKDCFDVDVYIEEDDNGYYIKSAVVKIHSGGIFIDAGSVIDYFEENFDASCAVVYS